MRGGAWCCGSGGRANRGSSRSFRQSRGGCAALVQTKSVSQNLEMLKGLEKFLAFYLGTHRSPEVP